MRFSTNKPVASAGRAALRHVHRGLRARIRRLLHEADREFIGGFPGLIAAVETGLRHEETILEDEGAPYLRERRADNAIILCALHRVAIRVEQGQAELGRQVAAALEDMLALHRLSALLPADQVASPPDHRYRRAHARLWTVPARKRHLGHVH